MITVNEYRRDFVGRIRGVRRTMDKRRKEIEMEQGLDKVIARGKIRFEEAKTTLSNVLQQRKNSIMGDVNLSTDAKESIINVYEQEYSLKIKEKESEFKNVCESVDRKIEDDKVFRTLREKLEEILSERNSEVYRKAEEAHMDERNKFLELKKAEQQVAGAKEDLAVAELIFKQKQGARVLNEQGLERIDSKRQLLKEKIGDLKKQLDEANSMLPGLDKSREAIFNNLESVKKEERVAKEGLKQEEDRWMDALEAREIASRKLIERQIENAEVNINTGVTINKDIKGGNEIQPLTGGAGNNELLENDKRDLLEEIEKISSMRGPKIGKYVGIYERLGYTIFNKSAFVSQLTAARKSYPSLLGEIKNDLVKKIQDPENNKPQEKRGIAGAFSFIDFSCYGVNGGIILAEDMKTILCAAPKSAYRGILTGEIKNFTQEFNRNE